MTDFKILQEYKEKLEDIIEYIEKAEEDYYDRGDFSIKLCSRSQSDYIITDNISNELLSIHLIDFFYENLKKVEEKIYSDVLSEYDNQCTTEAINRIMSIYGYTDDRTHLNRIIKDLIMGIKNNI